MKHRNMPAPTFGRQMNLEFEPYRLEGLDDTEPRKAVSTLGQILMQTLATKPMDQPIDLAA